MMASTASVSASVFALFANAFPFVELLAIVGAVAGVAGAAILCLTRKRPFALRASLLQSAAVLLLAVSVSPLVPRNFVPVTARVSSTGTALVASRVARQATTIANQVVAATKSNPATRIGSAFLFVVWLIGTIAFMVRLGRAMSLMSGIRRRARATARPRVLVSDEIDIPCAAGVIAPVILVPRESESWDSSEWDAILAHERTHIERHDVLMNCVRQLVLAIHWFNPVVRWLNGVTDEACEGACDDAVIIGGIERHTYASALISFASGISRDNPIQAAALIGRNGIEMRVAALIDTSRARRLGRRTDRVMPVSAGVIGMLTAILLAPAQTAFAVVSPIIVAAQTTSSREAIAPDTTSQVSKNRRVRKVAPEKPGSSVDDNAEAVAGLASLLSDPNPILRQSALDALRSWGQTGQSILRSLAAGPDEDRASSARAALAAVGESR
ncbi:MAG: M56 family metallopeptidase [Gemmatimonadales bacterium]